MSLRRFTFDNVQYHCNSVYSNLVVVGAQGNVASTDHPDIATNDPP